MATLADLATDVQELRTVQASAVALLEGLSTKLGELAPNQEAIDALKAELDGATEELAAAVTANTPADEPPPPPQ